VEFELKGAHGIIADVPAAALADAGFKPGDRVVILAKEDEKKPGLRRALTHLRAKGWPGLDEIIRGIEYEIEHGPLTAVQMEEGK
jgi:hypothetical protein